MKAWPLRLTWAVLRPSSCQTESSRSRGPSAAARQPWRVRSLAAPPSVDRATQASTSSASAMADAEWCCIRRRTGMSCGSRLPTTATISPPCVGSASQPVSIRGRGSACTTASVSSSGPVLSSAARKCQALLGSSPEAVTRRTVNPRRLRWTAIEAAVDTAASREEAMPWPRWARSRLSRNRVARDCHGCSSRRTISSPTRAELRQWTRRRSSPRRYSRTVTSSALPVANARGRLSPDPVQAPPRGIWGSGTVRGVTVSGTVVWKARPSSTRPNGSLTRTDIGPMSNWPRTSDRTW